jgi:hypothetical protein
VPSLKGHPVATTLTAPSTTLQTAPNNGQRGASEPASLPPFIWQQPEYRQCEHRPGPVAAINAQGQKLAFCLDCNLLLKLKPGTKTASAITQPDTDSEPV